MLALIGMLIKILRNSILGEKKCRYRSKYRNFGSLNFWFAIVVLQLDKSDEENLTKKEDSRRNQNTARSFGGRRVDLDNVEQRPKAIRMNDLHRLLHLHQSLSTQQHLSSITLP